MGSSVFIAGAICVGSDVWMGGDVGVDAWVQLFLMLCVRSLVIHFLSVVFSASLRSVFLCAGLLCLLASSLLSSFSQLSSPLLCGPAVIIL